MLTSFLSAAAPQGLRACLVAAAVRLPEALQAAAHALQKRGCMTHHRLWTAPELGAVDPRLHAPAAALHMGAAVQPHLPGQPTHLARSPLPVVHSEDGRAACGEPPHSPYACGMYGGLWQHGEAHNILFSDEHASVTNEMEKLLQVADELGGPAAVFKVVEQFGGEPEWSEMNTATAFRCLAHEAERMSEAAVQEQILSHPLFARLVEEASRRAPEMSDAELTEIGSACASLRYDQSALVEQVCA
ncbi:hypothetical protein COHA_005878 [Chlorella ohadii]|uniref:Uncharacterized protein n=1 Tax=Chlorella ohadii TaxID=2649997 RepID=A0AAD5H4D4_9CHLO|nr:hypothetical protein COHA_005878 [Chlorella ohadii]